MIPRELRNSFFNLSKPRASGDDPSISLIVILNFS